MSTPLLDTNNYLGHITDDELQSEAIRRRMIRLYMLFSDRQMSLKEVGELYDRASNARRESEEDMIQPECETCGTQYRLKAVLGGWTSVPACSCPQPASAPTTCTGHTEAYKFVHGME